MANGPRKRIDFGGNLDHVTLGLELWLQLGVRRMTLHNTNTVLGPSDTPWHWVCFTRCLTITILQDQQPQWWYVL